MLSWRKDKSEDAPPNEGRPATPAPSHDQVPSAQDLGDMLVEAGLITAEQAADALARSEADGTFVGRVLVESGLLDRKQLTSFIVKECRIPHLSLIDYEVNQDLLELIPKDICLQHRVLPIDKLGRILTLAMVNPLDNAALAQMRSICPQLKIKPILCDWEDYDQVATRLFAVEAEGGSAVSFSSFGLSESAPEKPVPPPKEAVPAAETPAPAPLDFSAMPPAAGMDAAALEGIVTALRDSLRESNRESLEALTTALAARASAETPGPDSAALAQTLEGSLTRALQESVGALAEEMRALRSAPSDSAAPPSAPPALDTTAIAQSIESGLARALQESVGSLADEIRALRSDTPPTTGDAPALDPAAVSAAIEHGVAGALKDSLGGLVDEIRALRETPPPPPPAPAAQPPAPGPLDPAALATALEDAMNHALEAQLGTLATEIRGLRTAESGTPAPAGPTAAELAEAIRESVSGALEEAVAPVLTRLADAPPAPGADPEAMAAALREALREVVAALPAAPPASANPEANAAIVAAIQESLQGAVKDIADTVQQAAATGTAAAGSTAADHLGTIAAEIRQSAEAAMEAVRASVSAQKDSIEALATDYASKVKRFNTVQPFRAGAAGDKAAADALEAVVLPEDERVRQALDASAPLEGFSFDGFLVSKANAFSVNIAKQIAAGPGGEHNPFFVFGPVGIGKTHLVNAVGNAIRAAMPDHRVGYASAGRFAGTVLEALHEHATAAFREAYCHWDVLILDDIQFLGGHVQAQEEFFHIFNALQQEGRQIIIAADKAPDQLGQLEQRLISRFAGGMVTPLEPPDYETRLGILKQLATQAKAPVPEDVLAVVATRIPRDVRKMAGAMRKIIAFTGLVGQDMTCDTAYDILNKMGVAEAVAP